MKLSNNNKNYSRQSSIKFTAIDPNPSYDSKAAQNRNFKQESGEKGDQGAGFCKCRS